ncbi:hypothetical protein D043_3056B, partial [Vibrio parahaemolyticus EKP-021]
PVKRSVVLSCVSALLIFLTRKT